MIKLVQALLLIAQLDYLAHKVIKSFVQMDNVYNLHSNANYLMNVVKVLFYVLINHVDLLFHNVQNKSHVNKVFLFVEMELVKIHV